MGEVVKEFLMFSNGCPRIGFPLILVLLVLFLFAFVSSTPVEAQPALMEGVKVQANGQDLKISVQTPALSTCVVDWNNDGKKDLLLGTYYPPHVYLFLNIGTDSSPAFGEGSRLKVGFVDLGMGANPFVVDWDNDGRKDLIVGDSGRVYLLLNAGTDSSPQFATKSIICSPTNGGGYTQPYVVDWDMDGRKDILVGLSGRRGRAYVYLYLNTASDSSPRFSRRTRVQANGSDISRSYGSAPIMTDWDMDGKRDLIIRETDQFTFYRNIGTNFSPLFGEGSTIQAGGENLTVRVGDGVRMFSVVDWNNDCNRDLVIGDYDGYVWVFLGTNDTIMYPEVWDGIEEMFFQAEKHIEEAEKAGMNTESMKNYLRVAEDFRQKCNIVMTKTYLEGILDERISDATILSILSILGLVLLQTLLRWEPRCSR
jgi:hypothetical protein